LCGQFVVELDERRVEGAVPGRQGRVLLGYLVLARPMPVARERLVDLLWPGRASDSSDVSLRALISKLRQALGDRLVGRTELRLTLPPNATVDMEVAKASLHDAESKLARRRWKEAWLPAQIAWSITSREFLVGCDGAWVEQQQRELAEDHLRALECIASIGLQLRAFELSGAERAARELIALAPYTESGYRLLMEALEARGETAEALLVYDRLRRLLRDDLGLTPSKDVQTVLERLLDD
jgi:DNA-binding SARP family transcriptional activator